jgi:hypothetical protein
MRLYRSDAGWQEHEKDIRAVIVSMSPPSYLRYGCIAAEPAAVSPDKIIVPRIVIGGVTFEQPAGGGIGAASVGPRVCGRVRRDLSHFWSASLPTCRRRVRTIDGYKAGQADLEARVTLFMFPPISGIPSLEFGFLLCIMHGPGDGTLFKIAQKASSQATRVADDRLNVECIYFP